MSLALNFRSTRFTLKLPFSSSSCSQQCLRHPDVSFFRHLLWQNARAISASACKTIGRSPIPQNSKLHCINLASFKTSLMLMISLSPLLSTCCPVVLLWLCSRQPPTHQITTRCRLPVQIIASPVSIEESLNDVRLACPRHERSQIYRPLDVPHSFDQLPP